MIAVVSAFGGTPIVRARTGDAYEVDAGSPLTLTAVNTHASAHYAWDLGDGTTATGPSVTHTYARDGVYVARLTVVVDGPGGARTRFYARVQARNVAPTVDAGADLVVDEGEVVALTGRFADPEWPDTHEATWSWGDGQGPTPGVVAETGSPPATGGTVAGSHAWGDDGTYTVTLTVRDDDGGVGEDTAQVTVRNVPPVVDAGPERFAYPCTVLTLVASFTDPGWLDTHVGTWAFGDCTPPQTALIAETNAPPAGTGSATASHVYRCCGDFVALCTVVDDDGGVGTASTVVRVVDVENAGFEEGFRQHTAGAVASAWEPYLAGGGTDAREAAVAFRADATLVHGGQRSQRIGARDGGRAGILQQVGANPGWDYQVSAWYALDEREAGVARLGLDPAGGTDPAAQGVVWTAGDERREWSQLAARVTAAGPAVTIFLEADAGSATVDACFDDVALLPIQPFCPAPVSPPRGERCVDFVDHGPRAELPHEIEHDGFGFTSVDGQQLTVVAWGDPKGVGKLRFRPTGVDVRLPFRSQRVVLSIMDYAGEVQVVGLDDAGDPVARADAAPYALEAGGLVALRVTGGGNESAIVSICATPQARREEADRPDPPAARRPPARRLGGRLVTGAKGRPSGPREGTP